MAEQDMAPDEPVRGNDSGRSDAPAAEASQGSFFRSVGNAITAVLATIGLIWDMVTSSPAFNAAGRQGLDEIGEALKPFPDSISGDALGTLGNPTPGEVDRDSTSNFFPGSGVSSFYRSYTDISGEPETWPSEIAKNPPEMPPDNGMGQENDYGNSL